MGEEHKKIDILRYFLKEYRWQCFFLLLIQFGTGLLEGLGVAAILPLLSTLLNSAEDQASSPLHVYVEKFFTFVNLDSTIENTLLLIVCLFTGKAVLRYAGMLYMANLTSKIILDLRQKLVKALLNSKWSFYVRNPTGMFVNALITEAQRSGASFKTLMEIFSALLQMIVLLIVAALASWQVIVAGTIVSVVLWISLYHFIKASGKAGREQKDVSRHISIQITDILQNYKPLKAMHVESNIFDRIESAVLNLFKITRDHIVAKQGMNIFHEPIFIIITCLGLYGTITFLNVETTILMILLAIFYRFVTSWRLLQQGYQSLVGQESFFWSLQDLIVEAEQEEEKYRPGITHTLKKNITFKDVDFRYQNKMILRGLNITMPAKKLIGLCGPSGTGKTTIVDLICRLYTPENGEILIDDQNLESIDLNFWRKHIGYVPQEFVIFNDTIKQNIVLGDNSISDEDVIRALKQAEAWSFIKKLPEGINTKLTQGGWNLSGGQRQRISIARALVRNPVLLILDEATASLDPDTERDIFRTLKTIASEITIIAVSHQQIMKEQADAVIDLGRYNK